jgi:two-component system, chemotaxis family, chemotaxis protein CheY
VASLLASVADILLIDDDFTIRALLSLVLGAAGHTVREAQDGDEGVKQYHAKQPDIVITDLVMPTKGGLEVIAEIRRSKPAAKIIGMSGATYLPSYLKMVELLGESRVISKPFTPVRIVSAVADIMA